MPQSAESYISLLMQIPLVGMFIWFTIRQNHDFLSAMEKRDEQWRVFLKAQTDSRNDAIARIAEEVKNLGREISELRGRNGGNGR
jgi:Na+/phosphate symporter